MKLKYNLLLLLAVVFCFSSCQKVRFWEETDVEFTDIYYIQPATQKIGQPFAYSVYHEIGSFLIWANKFKVTSDNEMRNFEDTSAGEDVNFTFTEVVVTEKKVTNEAGEEVIEKTEKEVVYTIDATNDYNVETGGLNAAIGKMTVTKDGKDTTIDVHVFIKSKTIDPQDK